MFNGGIYELKSHQIQTEEEHCGKNILAQVIFVGFFFFKFANLDSNEHFLKLQDLKISFFYVD